MIHLNDHKVVNLWLIPPSNSARIAKNLMYLSFCHTNAAEIKIKTASYYVSEFEKGYINFYRSSKGQLAKQLRLI